MKKAHRPFLQLTLQSTLQRACLTMVAYVEENLTLQKTLEGPCLTMVACVNKKRRISRND